MLALSTRSIPHAIAMRHTNRIRKQKRSAVDSISGFFFSKSKREYPEYIRTTDEKKNEHEKNENKKKKKNKNISTDETLTNLQSSKHKMQRKVVLHSDCIIFHS